MTADANEEKALAKFPKASLRARNKTMMMQPADVADFQVDSKDDGFSALDVDDIFGESLDDAVSVKEINNDSESDLGPDDFGAVVALAEDSLGDLGADLSEEVEVSAGDSHAPPQPEAGVREEPLGVNHDDIFSAPVVRKEESVDPMPSALDVGRSWTKEIRGEAQIEWKKPSKLVGFLVSFAADQLGSYVELREGRLLISREGSSSDSCLVLRHESVSQMHAIMRISGNGEVLILDQLSEHGTKIKRAENGKEECLMGDKSALNHGDIVIFGECEYHVALLGAAALRGV